MYKLMKPLWLKYPELERYSIGWRMGYGEEYACDFWEWFDELSEEEQKEYKELFPEPVTWKGFWENESLEDFFEQDDFLVEFWRKGGEAKYTVKDIQKQYNEGDKKNFVLFWGHTPNKNGIVGKSCFSQWWKQEFFAVTKHYFCMEQYMMAQKAILFNDKDILQQIFDADDQKAVKDLGRKVHNFDQELWDKVKYSIVLNGNWRKFSQNKELRDYLLSTGESILVEASPYDKIWGIGLSAEMDDAQNPNKWLGENLLGFALMEIRDELRKVVKNENLCSKNEEDN